MKAELIANGFSFPTSVAFSEAGQMFVAESGLPWDGAPEGGRIWRLDGFGGRELVADGLRPPVNGLTWHDGRLYIAESGHPARLLCLEGPGRLRVILEDLPGPGNYHANTVLPHPDGWLYFSQGAMTNSGIIGLDALEIGWLGVLPHAADVPGLAVELTDYEAETITPHTGESARTGAFAAYGARHNVHTRLSAHLPCTAAVMRCRPDGSHVELVAWGLRNAYGLCLLPDGRMLATDQGADDRGSRPIGNAPDALYEVRGDRWYGWPDFVCGEPVTHPRFRPERGPPPVPLLANHQELPTLARPLLEFPLHSAAVKLDVVPGDDRRVVVALFGDEAPMTAAACPEAVRGLAMVDLESGGWRHQPLPELQRPLDARFGPDGSLWVVDFGEFEMSTTGVRARRETGSVWRVALD